MRRNTDRRGAEILPLCAAGIFLVYLAFFPAVIYSVDGNSMIAVSESLVTGHGFAVPIAGLGVIGRQGVFYSRWYPLLSILASLLVGVAIFTSHHLGLPQHYVAALFAVTLSPILAAASAMMVGMLAQRLGATTRGATLAALGFAFGTIAPVYSRLFFADPLLALLTIVGIYFALIGEWRGATAAALLAVLAKPTGIVLGPCLGSYLICKRQPAGRWIAPWCGMAMGLLIYFAYNWARFANPLDFGQPETFALHIVPYAIAGLLIFAGPGAALV
jgi:Gpi18-like mannosyltransferase